MSARFVRARLKPVEMWPAWARCCEQGIANVVEGNSTRPILVNPFDTVTRPCHCRQCGKGTNATVGVREDNGTFAPLDLLDLEEAPLSPAEQQTCREMSQ